MVYDTDKTIVMGWNYTNLMGTHLAAKHVISGREAKESQATKLVTWVGKIYSEEKRMASQLFSFLHRGLQKMDIQSVME